MEFAEFREKHDHYGAYAEWVTVAEAKETGLIPEAYHEYFPDRCECGSQNIIKTNLRQMTCCNPKCYQKEACQLSEFLTRSGIMGFGEANCARVLRAFRRYDKSLVDSGRQTIFPTNSFLDIFDVPEDNWPLSCGSALSHNFAVAVETLKNDNLTFPELISRLGIESVGSSALKIFDGISNSKELAHQIEVNGGVRLFCYSRGVYAPDTINNIYESLIDIANAERLFHKSLRYQGLVGVDICVTGSTCLQGVSLTKSQLIDVLNRASIGESGIQFYEFRLCTALQSAPFILYTTKSNSAKFRAGLARGETTDAFGTHPVLMQVDDFFELLKKQVDMLEEEVRQAHGQ